ncbi:MAG: MBL fold metallo-hydrolase [Planctomycetes bacterium]|nr:MBL fold metallo-hydrolase [Planctomycetota bacterium]
MFQHGSLRIEVFCDEMFGENGYLVWHQGRPECWIIDPGLPPAPGEFLAAIQRLELAPTAIVLTHGHADHIAGVRPIRAALGPVPIWCPRGEAELLVSAEANLSAFIGMPIVAEPADRLLDAGETVNLGEAAWTTRDVAGHSPGGMAYVCQALGVAFTGDAVFADSIGRYDFPHSSHRRLIENIRDNVLTLPDDMMIYSGHGPPATVGRIRQSNRVLQWELSNLRG